MTKQQYRRRNRVRRTLLYRGLVFLGWLVSLNAIERLVPLFLVRGKEMYGRVAVARHVECQLVPCATK